MENSIRLLIDQRKKQYSSYSGEDPNSYDLSPYSDFEYQIGCMHGERILKGLSSKDELYLIYLEKRQKQVDEATKKNGFDSYERAELIINRLAPYEFYKELEEGKQVFMEEEKQLAQNRLETQKAKGYEGY